MYWKTIATAGLVLGGIAVATPAEAAFPELRVERYLNEIRDDPGRLLDFVRELPKGGDLHTHLSGAVPTASLIDLAIADDLCLDTWTYTAGGIDCGEHQRPVSDAKDDPEFQDAIMRAWSMKGFNPAGGVSGHDHFFATFGRFSAATERKGEMLAIVASRSARQKITYLEPLISRQSSKVKEVARRVGYHDELVEMRNLVLADPSFPVMLEDASKETDLDLARMREVLRCGTQRPDPGCAVAIRIDHQVSRATKPENVFVNLLLGFELAGRNGNVVGVNLVQPEDDPQALAGYRAQMRMIRFMRPLYPDVKVSLHAGELTRAYAPSEDLRFHVRDAVSVAQADRIGHGVDIAGEFDMEGLLTTMAERKILVEVPLTSNCQILEVCGPEHPFALYRAHGVPVALATDDEGVSHTDLSHEFQKAVQIHELTYADLKTLARASLEHAFIEGKSLYAGAGRMTGACNPSAGPSEACKKLLTLSPKATLQWLQELSFLRFETRYGGIV